MIKFHLCVKYYVLSIGVICSLLCWTSFVEAYEKEINSLASVMADKIASAGKKTIAVVDFTDLEGNVTQLGRFIAEEVSGALAETEKGFEVVNRNNLKLILQEYKLFETGVIDPKTAMKLGEIAGVEALITGTITPFTENIRLSVSVLDIMTAKVIDNKRIEIPRTKDIDELFTKEVSSGKKPETISYSVTITPAPEVQKQKLYEKGFSFELQECKKLGSTVRCLFLVTSEKQDRDLHFYFEGFTRIFDNLGNQYTATNENYSVRLIADVAKKVEAIFEGIALQAKGIAVLELSCTIFDQSVMKLQFRNVVFSQ